MYQTLNLKSMILTLDEVKNLKKHPRNRELNIQQVKKITAAFENGEIVFPIVVNRRTMHVIDGQHRRAAFLAYIGNHPELASKAVLEVVSMDIPEDKEFLAIIEENSATVKWKPADYINAYAEAGNVHYIRLRNFMKKCRFCHSIQENKDVKTIFFPKITNAMALLAFRDNGTSTVNYKNGSLELTDEEVELALTRAKQLETVLQVTDPNNTLGTRALTYLIGAWVLREKQDLGLSAESRLAFMLANKRSILRKIKDSENKLSKASDWNAIFDYIANCMYAEQKRGGSASVTA